MRPKLENKVGDISSWIVGIILVLVPFFAFITVWPASAFGHYTLFRLWDEFLLVLAALSAIYFLYKDAGLRRQMLKSKIVWLIAAYIGLQIVWGVVALLLHNVDAKALGYAWIVNLRFLIFFLAVWVIASRAPQLKKRWPALVFWPALVVALVAILQYLVLPYDVLKHFGYNANTIFPYETINHNLNYPRVMSTLRGANPLGAYLVVALGLLAALPFRRKDKWWWRPTLGVAALLALVFSFSRSAWIGAVLAVIVLVWMLLKTAHARRLAVAGAGIVVVMAIGIVFALHGSTSFQNAIFHTSDKSTVKISSNEGHESALASGVRDVLHEPLGRGPGTAGPASVYNNHPARIAENYFIQIAQETGWLGLVLFLTINILVAKALWQRRENPLALGLFAALIGVSFVNLLSHAWTDDTLAYLWWGLAALAFAQPAKLATNKR